MLRAWDKTGRLIEGGIDFIEAAWDRKWSMPGEFAIYMALDEYKRLNALGMKYIENVGRPETGVLMKRDYSRQTEGAFVTISGFFLEKLLNYAAYRKCRVLEADNSQKAKDAMSSYVVNANAPVTVGGKTYKPIGAVYFSSNSVYPSEIDVSIESETQMGQGLYDCLDNTGYGMVASVRTFPPADGNGDLELDLLFKKGRIKTSGEEGVFFGKAYNNVDDMKYTFDESDEICLYEIKQDVEADVYSGFSSSYFPIKFTERVDGETKHFICCTYYGASNRPTDLGESYSKKIFTASLSSDECDLRNTSLSNQRKIRALMQKKARLDMLDHYKIETIEINVIPGRYEYMKDYDLGDTCVALIDDMQKIYHARIEEIHEKHQDNRVDIELVLGTPAKQKWR